MSPPCVKFLQAGFPYLLPEGARGKCVWLYFDGVFGLSQVWVNGQELRRYDNGKRVATKEAPEAAPLRAALRAPVGSEVTVSVQLHGTVPHSGLTGAAKQEHRREVTG